MQEERVYITWNICTISTWESIKETILYYECSYNKLKEKIQVYSH